MIRSLISVLRSADVFLKPPYNAYFAESYKTDLSICLLYFKNVFKDTKPKISISHGEPNLKIAKGVSNKKAPQKSKPFLSHNPGV